MQPGDRSQAMKDRPDRMTEIELFVQTVELSSLSRAAAVLGITGSTASRYLSSLEKRLGALLLQRSTRKLSLTGPGAAYFAQCKEVLATLAEADSAVHATVTVPSGLLRVTASVSCCLQVITPILPDYTSRHPAVRVQLVAANHYDNGIDDKVDVAIRTREAEPDSGITIRSLARTRRILAASPRYLARRGTPHALDELAQHDLLLYSYSHRHDELSFRRGDEQRTLRVSGLLEANDGQIIRAAALEGLGIAVQPRYVLHDDIIAGRLVPILDEWDLPRLQMNIAFQNRRHLSAKVRSFVDFMTEHFARMDYERKWTAFD